MGYADKLKPRRAGACRRPRQGTEVLSRHRAGRGRLGGRPWDSASYADQGVAPVLVGDREAPEGCQCRGQVLGRVQFEGIEAAAGQQEQLIALECAARAQFVSVAVALAQEPRLGITP